MKESVSSPSKDRISRLYRKFRVMSNNSRKLGQLKTYDSRTKLYILTGFLVMTLVTWKVIPLLISFFAMLLILFLSKVRFNKIALSSLSAFALELVIGLILELAVSVKWGLYITFKMLTFTLVFNAIVYTMDQASVLDALSKGFGLSAKWSKRMSIMLNFCPRLYKERQRAVKAQKARGISDTGINFRTLVRRQMILTVPNLKSAYIRSRRQSRAMETRGYTSVKRRSPIVPMAYTWVDDLALIVLMIFVLASVLFMII